jgi:hypothetical protein
MTWDEWVSQNPLKQWMVAHGVTQTQVASHFGRSPFTVYTWLRGIRPDFHNADWFWDGMRTLTADDDIEAKWRSWEQIKPQIGGKA